MTKLEKARALQVRRSKKAAVKALKRGGTITSSAGAAGVSRQTIYNWMREDKAFGQQMTDAEDRAEFKVIDKLFEMTQEKNLGAICFWLKCRRGWKEHTEAEHIGRTLEEALRQAREASNGTHPNGSGNGERAPRIRELSN